MADERREDELPPDPQCTCGCPGEPDPFKHSDACPVYAKGMRDALAPTAPRCRCRRGPSDSLMHDAGCPLRELDPRTSDSNVGRAPDAVAEEMQADDDLVTGMIAEEPPSDASMDGARALKGVLDGMDFTDGVKPGTVEHLIGELLDKGFRITSGSRGEPQSHHHYVAPIFEPRCTCDIARKLLIEHGAIPHAPGCPVAQEEDARSSVGGAIPDAPHRADAGTGTSTRVVETPDDLCVVSIFGRVNEIAPGHGVGTTSARFDAEGAREVRDRLDAYLVRVEHRASEPPALHMTDEEAFDLGLPRWASWTTNDERHVVGFVDLPDGKTDPRLALFELRSRADAMFVVDLLKRVGAQPMAVSVEKLRELRIASEAVAETEGSA